MKEYYGNPKSMGKQSNSIDQYREERITDEKDGKKVSNVVSI
jgi:hypothetical protein